MDNQMRMLDLGQEAVVLSGLQKQTSSSLKNIKNLYDETKYLKTYLEKVKIILFDVLENIQRGCAKFICFFIHKM